MNIEEAIDILAPKENIDLSNHFNNARFFEAIYTLLTAYEKEKGENVKLRLQDIPLIEGELKAYKDRVNELKAELEKEKEKNKELNWKYTASWVDEHFVSKDKIKAKIEEINKEMLNEENSLELFYRKKYCKEILQSLLEKE